MPIHQRDLFRIFQTIGMLKRVWLFVFLLGLYSLLPVFKEYSNYSTVADLPSNIFSILGLVLSLVLVFRTNRAYDRWWEARTLWGKLVNISRNVSIKIHECAELDLSERKELHLHIASFSFALKDHLRNGVNLKDVPGWDSADENPQHVPSWIVRRIYRDMVELVQKKRLSDTELLLIDTDLHEFLNVCGGCERIRNTLIAGSYRSYAIKSLALYLFVLPWGLVQDLNWLTVPITMILGYMMVGLETIADTVEEPFGTDLDDLKLEDLCHTIDRTTAELLEVPVLVPVK